MTTTSVTRKSGRGPRGMDWRGMAIALGGGAMLLLFGAQLLAKPKLPPVARAAVRDGAAAGTASASSAGIPGGPAPLAIAGEPPIRELFRPLVGTAVPAPPRASGPVPTLPPAGGKAPAASTSAPSAAAPASIPAAPTAPRVSDLQMLGVVESDGQPQVLLKLASTGQSRYFGRGEQAFGFKVVEIAAEEVSLAREGKTEKLAMSTAVLIEGSGSTSLSGSSSFSRERGSPGGDRNSRREERREDRRDRREGGESSGGGFTTTELFSLPTWTERLKKLAEIKGQLEPARYERLKSFMESRAKAEQGK